MQTHTTVRRRSGIPGDAQRAPTASLGRSNRVYKKPAQAPHIPRRGTDALLRRLRWRAIQPQSLFASRQFAIHASRDLEQARRTEQGCEDDGSKRRCNSGANSHSGWPLGPNKIEDRRPSLALVLDVGRGRGWNEVFLHPDSGRFWTNCTLIEPRFDCHFDCQTLLNALE
jgi:hypothetical protein